jgi:hypothetical protein
MVKTGGLPIRDAIMPLPYQPPNQALMALVGDMAQTGMRIGGTSEQQVGEGNSEAPVGTTLAMIEQATKVMNAVHKRMHASQAQEFQLLKECFKDNPESFWQRNNQKSLPWDEKVFLEALDNCNLIPQADPNTASHGQRVMKIMALKQLQAANPSMYDPIAIDTAALQAIGWNNPSQFLVPQQAQEAPPPELIQAQAQMENQKMDSEARMMVAQAKVAETQAKIQQGAFAPKTGASNPNSGQPTALDIETLKIKMMDAETRARAVEMKAASTSTEDQNRDLDRQSRERVQLMELARDILTHPESVEQAEAAFGDIRKEIEE